ncbi:hypothetical protein [Sphingomonas desiccabilis]|uniref:Uncharacterized protein n=1 Tax=Sphingomonas desiccabilis TaxID=429134 RepID=A0A4Q2J0U6_9SPHN|nr:hypothetical protein [Sphingomonas desiccabilis]MBB3910665.1 hypothetical protein [Sphingomonas desiccabilis]RXZ35290.1 hypothetical protein EO081_06585 [Sphingomonas desiccabilis]
MKPFFLATLAALLATGSTAQAQTAACVTRTEAEALVLFVAPDLIRQTGQRCATVLPASALLRQSSGTLIAKYEAEAERAWPEARKALLKIAGPDVSQMLDSAFAKPMVGTLVAPLVTGNLQAKDCATVERALTLVQPLPARNTAALLVLFAQADAASPRPMMRLPLCPAGKE